MTMTNKHEECAKQEKSGPGKKSHSTAFLVGVIVGAFTTAIVALAVAIEHLART
jgi:hypothetical protein